MNILVIGGSYFYGKAFVKMVSKDHSITVFNRGTVKEELSGIRYIKGDRHDIEAVRAISGDYDVVVDFCAYEAGDIEGIVHNLKSSIRQYIFISTVDVYKRGVDGYKTEETEYEDRLDAMSEDDGASDSVLGVNQVAAYINGKIALERELKALSEKNGFAYTILRPAILYGEGNYAGREDLLLRYIREAHILPMVVGAEGSFQMVHVEDAAAAICLCLGNDSSYNESYNLCGDEIITYESFYETLSKYAGTDFKPIRMNVSSALEQGAPTPFPLTKEESELYSNEKSKKLGVSYRSLDEGMAQI